MQQPSAQGIASLYMGNPGPLQNRVKQEQQQAQQGKIAPDLQRLMDALGIVETVQQGSQRQNAMNQMQQMGGPNPPTVAQSLEQRAHQALQARMVQEMQKQQAMQGQQGIPQGVPQPQRQPQGIDNLPVEFQMAGGGIVAFEGGGTTRDKYETPYDRARREENERAAREQAERIERIKASGSEAGATTYGEQMRALGSAIDRAVPDPVDLFRRIVGDPSLAREERRKTASSAAAETSYDPATATRRSEYAPEERPPVADLKALATQAAPRPAPMPAPSRAEQGLGAAAQALRAGDNAVPGGTSDSRQTMLDALALNPDARSALITDKYKSAVPAPDFTQRNAAIEALKAERERYQNKQPGWDSLMEYLGQVAATPRGLRSFEAGAMGARNLRAQEEANAQKRYDLGMKIIEQEQGKIDAMQNYAKDVYGVGKSEYDNIYKTKLEVAKTLTTDEREARKLATEMTMKELEMKNRIDVENLRAKNDARNRPYDYKGEYFRALQSGDKARAAQLLEGMRSMGEVMKPGLDITKVKNFQTANQDALNMLGILAAKAKPTEKDIQNIGDSVRKLTAAARAQGIDPETIPELSGRSGSTPVESVGTPPPGAVREVKR